MIKYFLLLKAFQWQSTFVIAQQLQVVQDLATKVSCFLLADQCSFNYKRRRGKTEFWLEILKMHAMYQNLVLLSIQKNLNEHELS